MAFNFTVRTKKQIRVIIDTDADCEADDPFAIAHALMSPKLVVKAIFATHFNEEGSMMRSYEEIQRVLKAMKLTYPVYKGAEKALSVNENVPLSPASEFLIDEALREDEKPLYVLCLGAITNVAAALKEHPEISKRMKVIWISGHDYKIKEIPFREFNSGNDIASANFIMENDVELWQVPTTVYGKMRIGLAEMQRRIYPCGDIGKHLFEKTVKYNGTDKADWTPGESWSLGDSPAIALAIDEGCGKYEISEAPIINDDTSYTFVTGRRKIRVYHYVDSRFVLEDFMSKLELLYGM